MDPMGSISGGLARETNQVPGLSSRRDLFIPDGWRPPTTFDSGSRKLTISKSFTNQSTDYDPPKKN